MSNDNRNNSDVEGDFFNRDDNDDLRDNIGRVITVFTQSGGLSGSGFTGLLVDANCRFIKLITQLPSAPCHPFGLNNFGGFNNGFNNRSNNRCNFSRFGTVIVIPVNKIVSFVFNEI